MANLLAVAQANVRNRWRSNPVTLLLREFNPDEPRDEDGKWTDGGGSDGSDSSGSLTGQSGQSEDDKKYQSEKLITDGPMEGQSRVGIVSDPAIGIWGASHSGSTIITGFSAEVMGVKGYKGTDPTDDAKRVGTKFLEAVVSSGGANEKLYHGFRNVAGISWKVGDTLKLPLIATSGDAHTSIGYGVSYGGSDEQVREKNKNATVFEFEKGTPFAGYSRWDREQAKETGHQWSEAIVAGEFKVTGMRTVQEPGFRKLPVTVVELKTVGVFDPASKTWREHG